VAARLGAPADVEKVADDFIVQDFAQGVILQFSNRPDDFLLFTNANTWQAEEK